MALRIAAVRSPHRRMLTLAATTLCAAGMVAALLPTPEAHAWGNGGDRVSHGHYVNGYGTHDWVMDQAYRLAGSPGWLNIGIARVTAGYPDVYWPYPTEHVFMEAGNGRGAAEQASEWYVKTVAAYRAGNYQAASYDFGVMSHYYADVTQPFHTSFNQRGAKAWHHPYETLTTAITDSPTAAPSYCDPHLLPFPVPKKDVRNMVVQAAAYSRAYFPSLARALTRYSTTNPHMVRNSTVVSVTKHVLSWACSGLAELLQGVPSAAAMPLPVTHVNVRLVRQYVPIGLSPKVDVTAYDRYGRVMNGVEFHVSWLGTKQLYTRPGAATRTHGANSRHAARAVVRVTVMNPGGPTSVAASSSPSALVVSKKFRIVSHATLVQLRKAARKAGRPWHP